MLCWRAEILRRYTWFLPALSYPQVRLHDNVSNKTLGSMVNAVDYRPGNPIPFPRNPTETPRPIILRLSRGSGRASGQNYSDALLVSSSQSSNGRVRGVKRLLLWRRLVGMNCYIFVQIVTIDISWIGPTCRPQYWRMKGDMRHRR